MKISTSITYLWLTALLMLLLSACSVSTVQTPNRPVEISVEAALAAQEALTGALATGQITLSEAEFSSFLTKLLEANTGANQPVASIIVWIDPDLLHFRVTLKEGVLLPAAGNTLDLVGNLVIVDGQLQLQLAQAASGDYVVDGALLAPIAAQINGALAQQLPTVPLTISQETGTLTISLGAAGGASDMPATAAAADTIAGILVASAQSATPEFTSLLKAVDVAGFADLLSREGPYTVFAPTDAAFAALPSGMLDSLLSSVISTQAVLQYHVLDGKFLAADVAALAGEAAPTLFGAPLAISLEGETVVINGTVQVVQTDIAASNGVIHVIDTVLIPERP